MIDGNLLQTANFNPGWGGGGGWVFSCSNKNSILVTSIYLLKANARENVMLIYCGYKGDSLVLHCASFCV